MIFNSSRFGDHVWTNIKLQGSDSLLVGYVYRSPSDNIDSSTVSLCDIFTSLDNYTHLLINFVVTSTTKKSLGRTFLVLLMIITFNTFLDAVDDLYFYSSTLPNLQGFDKTKYPAC